MSHPCLTTPFVTSPALPLSLHSLSALSASILSLTLRCNLVPRSLTPWSGEVAGGWCGWSLLCGGNGAVCCAIPLWFLNLLTPVISFHISSLEIPEGDYLLLTICLPSLLICCGFAFVSMDVELKRRMEGDDGENLGPLRKGEMCGEDEWGIQDSWLPVTEENCTAVIAFWRSRLSYECTILYS